MKRAGKKKGDRSDILAMVRKKLQEEQLGGAKGFWKPKEGRSVIRIMEGVGEMGDFFWQDVGKHYLPGQKFSHVCPEFTLGEACPICEQVNELYNAGDKASKDLAGDMRVSKQYWMNVIVRGQEDKGPQIFTAGITIFREIAALIEDPDYGEIYDEEDGVDITITRKGTDRSTEYTVTPKRKSSPLAPHGYEDVLDDWFDNAIDLSPVMLTEDETEDRGLKTDDAVVYVKPYDRMAAEFEALALEPDEDEEEMPMPNEEDETVAKALQRRRSPGAKRRRRR